MISRILILWATYAAQVLALSCLASSESAYEGWGSFSGASAATVLRTLVVLASVAALLSSRPRSTGTVVSWWFAGAMVVPAWVIVDWMTLLPFEQSLRTAVAVSVGVVVMLSVGRILPRIDLHMPTSGVRPFVAVLSLLLVAFFALAVPRLGLPRIEDLALDSVYERRAEFKLAVAGSFAAYAVPWTSQVLAPLALLAGIHYRKWGLSVLGVAASLYVYAAGGAKASLLVLGVAALLYWILGAPRSRLVPSWPVLILLFSLVPVAVFKVTGSDELLYGLTRRAFLVPGVDAVGHALLGTTSESRLVSLKSLVMATTGQLSDGVARGSMVVGEILHPGAGNNANSHFVSYGLQWQSIIPTLVVASMAAVLLWLFDCVGSSRTQRLAVPLGSVACLGLSESYLHTGLLTGGILFALVLVALLPPEVATTLMPETDTSRSTSSRQGRRRSLSEGRRAAQRQPSHEKV